MIQKLKHMYQFQPELQVIKKGSPGEIKRFGSTYECASEHTSS